MVLRNRLAGTRCYLAGGMDRAKDHGVGWRQSLKKELDALQISWLDPTQKPIDIALEDKASRIRRQEAKERGDWLTVGAEMNLIRRTDLRMVDISDFMIVHLDLNVYATGSMEELFLSNRQKKPILIHIAQGKKNCMDWLFGVIDHRLIFGTWQDLIDYVLHIAHDDEIDPLKRWLFFHPSVSRV